MQRADNFHCSTTLVSVSSNCTTCVSYWESSHYGRIWTMLGFLYISNLLNQQGKIFKVYFFCRNVKSDGLAESSRFSSRTFKVKKVCMTEFLTVTVEWKVGGDWLLQSVDNVNHFWEVLCVCCFNVGYESFLWRRELIYYLSKGICSQLIRQQFKIVCWK